MMLPITTSWRQLVTDCREGRRCTRINIMQSPVILWYRMLLSFLFRFLLLSFSSHDPKHRPPRLSSAGRMQT